MKTPAKIYVIQESIRISPSKSPAIIGDWATTETFSHDTEYIRRDVVIEVMKLVELDVIERYGDSEKCDFEGILNCTIEDADKERKEEE